MDQPSLLDQVKALAGFGGGATASFFILRWIERAVRWVSERHDKRQAQLDSEHAALDMSWKDYRLLLERDRLDLRVRVEAMEKQGRALRLSFEHVTAALIRHDPQDPALTIAERLMARAFPDDFTTLTAMAGAALDAAQGSN